MAEDEYLTPSQRKQEKKIQEKRFKAKGKEKMDEDEEDQEEEDDNMDIAIDLEEDERIRPPELVPIYSVTNPSIRIQLYQEILPI